MFTVRFGDITPTRGCCHGQMHHHCSEVSVRLLLEHLVSLCMCTFHHPQDNLVSVWTSHKKTFHPTPFQIGLHLIFLEGFICMVIIVSDLLFLIKTIVSYIYMSSVFLCSFIRKVSVKLLDAYRDNA